MGRSGPMPTPQPTPQPTVPTAARLQLDRAIEALPVCPLCFKVNDAAHRGSTRHQSKITEHLDLDVLAGQVPGLVRRLQVGFPGRLNRRAARRHWGSNIENLPQACMSRILARGVKIGKKMWRPADLHGKVRFELAFVSYKGAGAGKYGAENICVPWRLIPEGAPLLIPRT